MYSDKVEHTFRDIVRHIIFNTQDDNMRINSITDVTSSMVDDFIQGMDNLTLVDILSQAIAEAVNGLQLL